MENSTMNAVSLYLSTCKLVMRVDKNDPNTWIDLYRLVPYLRQSLSCTVCSNLALEPQSPSHGNCQHHICKGCQGGRKKLKPSCQFCREFVMYKDNDQLRSIQQCYKCLCKYFRTTAAYRNIFDLAVNSSDPAATNLMELICEGSSFKDVFSNSAGLSQSEYSILPNVYGNSATPFRRSSSACSTVTSTATSCVSNGQSQVQECTLTHLNTSMHTEVHHDNEMTVSQQRVYSVMTGSGGGNKLTFKRSRDFTDHPCTGVYLNESIQRQVNSQVVSPSFKKPATNRTNKNNAAKRKGCRCGNATPNPGKLTCCGQRCPCYVEGKACLECRCRGCRNPHRADGVKVRPHIPELQNIHIHYPEPEVLMQKPHVIDLDAEPLPMHSISYSTPNLKVVGLYSSDLNQISSTLPSAILMDDEPTDNLAEGESSDLDLDI